MTDNFQEGAEAMLRKEIDDAGDYAEQMRIIAGYKAGLQRAAEIAINAYPEAFEIVPPTKVILQLEHVIALGIEQAILRELSEDGSPSVSPED